MLAGTQQSLYSETAQMCFPKNGINIGNAKVAHKNQQFDTCSNNFWNLFKTVNNKSLLEMHTL